MFCMYVHVSTLYVMYVVCMCDDGWGTEKYNNTTASGQHAVALGCQHYSFALFYIGYTLKMTEKSPFGM